MTTQRTPGNTPNGQPVQARPEGPWERRITTLEARVEHLEAALEGFQDAVYPQSVLEGRRIAELGRQTEPHEMAVPSARTHAGTAFDARLAPDR